ncbi:MAG TPA: aminopeptidase P N-terminal domain-containing protein [Kofleriaceae bacterium]|nr:aminopeptidase P N-terminal domain-containing protein [Kofleriaceae bacterium]
MDLALFARRRDELSRRLGPRAGLLVQSPPELRHGAVAHRFRQASDLYYLTGFAEPETTLLIRPGAEKENFVLFVRPRDKEREVWDGRRAGIEGALADFGADAAYPTSELARRLPALLANLDELHVAIGQSRELTSLVVRAVSELRASERRGQRPPRALVDPRAVLHEMRLIKSAEEVATLRRAAAITGEAHTAAMRTAAPGVGEHELEALIDYTFRRRGGAGPGYSTIVGAGDNATILHYIENNRPLRAGELVLVDAGCEVDFYTADVTRTFPVDDRFSAAQRRVYEVVLDAQVQAIEMARPGVTIDDIHGRVVDLLTAGMVDLGLLQGPAADRVTDGTYRKYYMHRTSHWLGMDVHDVGDYNRRDGAAPDPRPLEAGMVITIEPGLYIAPDDESAPAELRGIGVRIEDDVLLTASGRDVLTAAIPKTVDDVERACAGG